MTQRQIDIGKEYQKNLKVEKNNRKRARTSLDREILKARRQLFCNERPVSPIVVQCDNTPMSYNNISDNIQTVFFMGYKFPSDQYYKCASCFVRQCTFVTSVEEEIFLHQHTTVGEISLKEFLLRWQSQDDKSNICYQCKKRLTIIRPYDSAHLDFE